MYNWPVAEQIEISKQSIINLGYCTIKVISATLVQATITTYYKKLTACCKLITVVIKENIREKPDC